MPTAASPQRGAFAFLALALLGACAGSPAVDPRYRPAENVLEVIAVLRRHVPDDTYRFDPARDFTGRNVYRSSLLRLENLERVHAEALRAGHLDGAIAFAKGRALERLRAFRLAADQYRFAAESEAELAEEALRSADVCESLERAAAIEIGLAAGERDPLSGGSAPELVLDRYDRRLALLESLEVASRGTHRHAIVREEIERADVERAHAFRALRHVLPVGDLRAVSELQRVVSRHRESRNVNRHLLSLADLYRELSEQYVAMHPPESLRFDPARFEELTDAGARLYEIVAARDGTPEKLEAARRLEAFLAFALRVDRDRFTH